MADLTIVEIARAQDATTVLRQQLRAILDLQNTLKLKLAVWTLLNSQHTPEEVTAALIGENSGLTAEMVSGGFAALVAVGTVLDENQETVIGLL